MNFELSEDQNEIKATARDLLTTRFKPERLRELATAAGAELDPPLDDLVHAPRPSTPFFGW